MRAGFLNYAEKKSRGQAKQNGPAQRFQGADHLPARRQIQMHLTIGGHGAQRVQNRGLGVWKRPEKTIRSGTDKTLNGVQNGGRKDCPSNNGNRNGRETPEPSRVAQLCANSFVNESEAVSVENHGK